MYLSNSHLEMRSIIFIIILFIFTTFSSLNAATLTYSNGFESGNAGGLKNSGNKPAVATSPTANGKYSGNFTLAQNMGTSYRTEATLRDGKGSFELGKEYWIGLNYYYADWAKDSSPETAPMQIHTSPSDWGNKKCTIKTESGSKSARKLNPFFMSSKNGQVEIATYGAKVRWTGPVQTKQWLNIVAHFKVSAGSDGFVEMWKDGKKLFRVDGPNSPKFDGCGKTVGAPYFKMGVYKWDWRSKSTGSSRRQLFIDDVKIATGSNGASLVSSASIKSTPQSDSTEDTTPPAISNVQASVTDSSATITWDTNEASDSLVKYGLNSKYGSNTDDDLLVTSHSVTMKNLSANELYHYSVSSQDASGNSTDDVDLTFTTDQPVEDDVVASWPMESETGTSVPDISGNKFTGELKNGAHLTTEGVEFDGIDDFMDAGKLDVAGNAMTMTGWFAAKDLLNCPERDCRIISKATGTAEQDHYFMVSTIKVGSATRLRFRLKINGTTHTLIAASGDIQENQWVHVAAVYDGKAMRLYKDGVEVGSVAKKGSITTNSNSSIWIGGNPPDATSHPWEGWIDYVSVYSYALTKEEIVGLANEE